MTVTIKWLLRVLTFPISGPFWALYIIGKCIADSIEYIGNFIFWLWFED